MYQGFVWNINSFDQEGVQLGKVLAKKVLAHDTDGALKAILSHLTIPKSYKLQRNNIRSLVQQLIERMLAISARLAENHDGALKAYSDLLNI